MPPIKIVGISLVIIGAVFCMITLAFVLTRHTQPVFTAIGAGCNLIGSLLMIISTIRDSPASSKTHETETSLF